MCSDLRKYNVLAPGRPVDHFAVSSCDWGIPPPPDPVSRTAVSGPVRVNSLQVVLPKLIRMVRPILPATTKKAGIKEPVVLEVQINEDGHVSVYAWSAATPF